MGGLRVEVSYTDDNKVKVRAVDQAEDNSREFESDVCNEFENYLLELSIYIDRNAEDTKKYLNGRTDYRDYVKVRNK